MQFEKTIIIHSSPSTVWKALTAPNLMKQWMGEPEMNLDIQTDWTVGNPIIISGFNHVKFENKGVVLEFEPNSKLAYTHLSSISRLPDKPENYTIFEFTLTPSGDGTSLTVTISNFPTESIFKHIDFYWRSTVEIIKKVSEAN